MKAPGRRLGPGGGPVSQFLRLCPARAGRQVEPGEAELDRQGHQPLLRPVVQVPFDAAALSLVRDHQPRPGAPHLTQLALARHQHRPGMATLEAGAGGGREAERTESGARSEAAGSESGAGA